MTDPQKPYYTSQDIVSPNIDTYYKKVMKPINATRSTFNANSSNISQTIALQDIDEIFSKNEINEQTPQESRVNAFYRMIGLPIVNADGTALYSPGFNPDINGDDEEIKKRLGIANSCLSKFKGILDDREFHSSSTTKYFQNQDVNSTALAVSSIFPRHFSEQLKSGLGPLEIDNQFFIVPDREFAVFNFQGELNEDTEKRIGSSTHILKPFIVDPRIDLTVTPAINRICAPFLKDKSKTQIARGNYLRRPYIERVIRTRFDSSSILPENNTDNQKFVSDIIQFAKSNTDITNSDIIDKLSNTLNGLHKSELVNISKLLKVIEAFVNELVESVIQINKIQTIINWKPIPNVSGPEYGCSMNQVDPNDTDNNLKYEIQISELMIQKYLNTTDFNIGIDQPDVGNFVFNDIDDVVFDTAKHNSDFYDKQLSQLNKKRDELGNKANNLLRNIEIITGEFSGLGLLDVLAIQTTLWSITPTALLGLIDKEAFLRMQEINALKTNIDQASPLKALQEFEKQISVIYNTISYFYNSIYEADKKIQQK